MGEPLHQGPDILHGWKGIAAHLKRSVRSVQRWEATSGLPVRRISTPSGGQIVYAIRAEIDEWKSRSPDMGADNESAAASEALDDTPGIPDTAAPGQPAGTRRSIRVLAGFAAITAALAAGIAAGLWLTIHVLPAWSTPTEFAVEGGAIVARNASGREVWRHTIGGSNARPIMMLGAARSVFTGDLDGDGAMEIAIPVSHASRRMAPAVTDAVYVFDQRGHLLQRIQPDPRMRDGDAVYEGPWRVAAVAFSLVSPGPVWIAYHHHTSNATFVVEASGRGEPSMRLLLSGRIHSLVHWRTPRGDYLAAGGVDRTYRAASLTLLDLQAPGARWPADGRSALSCEGCPVAPPRAVVVLPTSDVTRADFRPFGWVHEMRRAEAGLMIDMTNAIGPVALDTTFTLRPDLLISSVTRATKHWADHRLFEDAGRLTHTAEECPDATMPVEIRRWQQDEGWVVQALEPSPTSRSPVGLRRSSTMPGR